MRLSDLLVDIINGPRIEQPFATRPATVQDLVEALREKGGEVRQWHHPIAMHPKGRPELGDDLPPGQYLVFSIPDAARDEEE